MQDAPAVAGSQNVAVGGEWNRIKNGPLAFKAFGLSVWDRPSAPCLATRFPYGSPITHEGLLQVAKGERYLHEHGFRVVRVRHHGVMARLEVGADEIERLVAMREDVIAYFKTMGFTYVSVDLSGYRLGSLNEVLK